MEALDAAREIGATLARVGLAETDLGAIGATLARREPTSEPATPRVSAGPFTNLPRLALGDAADAGGDLVALREIGRGGMGVVHAAEQRSIGREVAVKTTRTGEPEIGRALVREARIMGALEHPSLVPVHALGVDATGAPLLVMKRIDGVSWRDLLHDPEHAAWAPLLVGHGDRLRANVDILAQLCRALAFAHERGVVHRDLKPENVMIGRFGEVVLLDWGVALRLSERETEPEGIVGTPGYLAPEMARADPRLCDARTDVYLLGATLYEVLTGRMIHEAPTALGALSLALLGELPPVPASAPAELAELVERACAREPGERPPTAEAFREGLAHFLATRDADALVADARSALARAAAATEKEGPASAAAFRALIEARFGLTSALKMRPGDAAIRAELESGVRRLVEREIALRSPDAARALLAELSSPPPELGRAIHTLHVQLAAERGAAEAMEAARREADASAAVRPLTLIWIVAGLVGASAATWFALEAAGAHRRFPIAMAMALDIVACLIWMGGLFLGRRGLFATVGTRRLVWTYSAVLWGVLLSDGLSFLAGRDVPEAAAHALLVTALLAGSAATTFLPDLWPTVVVHGAAIAGILVAPQVSSAFVIPAILIDVAIFVRAFRREGARSGTHAALAAPPPP